MKLLTFVPSRHATCSACRATSFSLAKYGSVYFSHRAFEQARANQFAGLSLVWASRARYNSLSNCPSLMSFLYRLVFAVTQKSEPVISALIACGSSIEALLVVALVTVFSIEALPVHCFCLRVAYLACCNTAPADSAFMQYMSFTATAN